MKKRFKWIAACAIAGIVLLSVSATASAASGGSGYQTFKDAAVFIALTENATVSAQFEVKDNGTVIVSGNTVQKIDGQNRSSNTSITVDGSTQTFQNTSDKTGKDESLKRSKLSESSSTIKFAELIADTLAGNVKNQFVTSGDTISVNLEGDQIPQIAKLAIAAAAENEQRKHSETADEKSGKGQEGVIKAVFQKMPQLTSTDVKSISMKATVSGNTLTSDLFSMVITGLDVNGIPHQMDITIDAKISNVNVTNADMSK